MILNLKSNTVVLGIALLIVVFFVGEVDARGRGGGGRSRGGGKSFSRGGIAHGGGFSGRSNQRTRPVSHDRQQQRNGTRTGQGHLERDSGRNNLDDRQKGRDERREDIQNERRERQEDRQDFVEDEWDGHYYHGGYRYHGYYGGTTVTYITTLPCTSTVVVVNGVSYYNCSSTWYKRGYSGSNVTYIVVAAPPGH